MSDQKTAVMLWVDGGGIRGLIPAIIPRDLRERLAKRVKCAPPCKDFDLIAGTSTGGIIAAGLTARHPDNPADSPDQFRSRPGNCVCISLPHQEPQQAEQWTCAS